MSGYEKIESLIEKWCSKTGWWYCDMIVTIAMRYENEKSYTNETTLLEWDGDSFVWVDDWWEGQQFVKLLGFMPVQSIELHNAIYLFDEEELNV